MHDEGGRVATLAGLLRLLVLPDPAHQMRHRKGEGPAAEPVAALLGTIVGEPGAARGLGCGEWLQGLD